MEVFMERRGQTLVPVAAHFADDIETLPVGKPLRCKITQARSLPFDRLYRACVSSICKSGGYDKGPDCFHELTKTMASFIEVDVTPCGKVVPRTKSIAHSSTDHQAFRQFFDNAINAWHEYGYYEWVSPDLREKLESGER